MTTLLDGIELIVFDKDGTLIEFDAMWGPWVLRLAHDVAAASGLPLGAELPRFLGFDPVAGRTRPGALLAATPMARLRDLTEAWLVEQGLAPRFAGAVLRETWDPPDAVALAVPVVPLRPLFDGLAASGRRIAVATSDDRVPTERTLDALGIRNAVAALLCADDGFEVKPAAAMVVELCRRLAVPPGRTAVVGDSVADMAMGRNAGAGLVVGVLSGVASADELAPLADAVLPSVGALVED